jgi:hypothetical protein
MKKTEKQEERKAAPEVRINGQKYRLRFDLWALEKIEEEFGGIKEAFQALHGGSMVTTARKMFAIMANCQRNLDGMPEDVTEESISRHTSMAKLAEISGAIQAAVEKGMESETNGGEADDEPQDALAEEYDRKNGSTGGQPAPGNTTGTR